MEEQEAYAAHSNGKCERTIILRSYLKHVQIVKEIM